MYLKTVFSSLLCIAYLQGISQFSISTFSGKGISKGIRAVTIDQTKLALGIQFEDAFNAGDSIFESKGAEDGLLICYNNLENKINWAIHLGSQLKDQITALEVDENGDIFVAGSYGIELTIGDQNIRSEINPRGLFFASFNKNGDLKWVKNIRGPGIKELKSISISSDQIIVSGYFEERLSLDSIDIKSNGIVDGIVLAFSKTGNLIWDFTIGGAGKTRIKTASTLQTGEIIIGGTFDDAISIDSMIITANTQDEDVFLARLSENGHLSWLKKAGGVLDDQISAIQIENETNAIVFGDLVGVMRLSETLSIQSNTGQPDLYLARYRLSDGQPINAITFNNNSLTSAGDLKLVKNNLFISGLYLGAWEIQNFQFSSPNKIGSYLIELDTSFQIINANDLYGKGGDVFFENLVPQGDDLHLFGSISKDLNCCDNESLMVENFSAMLLTLDQSVTGINHNVKKQNKIKVFPNPTTGILNIDGQGPISRITVFNLDGKSVFSKRNANQIDLSNLPNGIYELKIEVKNKILNTQIVKTDLP